MSKDLKIAMVVFDTYQPAGIQKEYAYRTDLDLQPDDLVVVMVKEDQFKIVQVVAMLDMSLENAVIANKATKYIVDKIDLTSHIKRINAAERMTYIKGQLEEKKAKMEEIAVFQLLAESDPEAKRLLDEMKQLTLEA